MCVCRQDRFNVLCYISWSGDNGPLKPHVAWRNPASSALLGIDLTRTLSFLLNMGEFLPSTVAFEMERKGVELRIHDSFPHIRAAPPFEAVAIRIATRNLNASIVSKLELYSVGGFENRGRASDRQMGRVPFRVGGSAAR